MLVDVQLHLVDGRIAVDHALRQRGIALEQRLDRFVDLILDHRSHPQKELFEVFEFYVEMAH
ncbi:hypothetical protein D3C83_27210 [compost metagenome]